MKSTRKSLNNLFIGNSHTYYNDMKRGILSNRCNRCIVWTKIWEAISFKAGCVGK